MLSLCRNLQTYKYSPSPSPSPPPRRRRIFGVHRWLKGRGVEPGAHGGGESSGRWAWPSRWGRPRRRRRNR